MHEQSEHFDKFTERSKKALVRAQYEAQRRGQASIEPEHLLLGLLVDPASTACELLQELGVVPGMMRAAVEASLPQLPGEQTSVDTGMSAPSRDEVALAIELPVVQNVEPIQRPQLSPRLKQIITFAVAECMSLRQPRLVTGHFLLGILREEQGRLFFYAWGIDLKEARAKMKRLGSQLLAAEDQPFTSEISASEEAQQALETVQIDPARQQKIIAQTRKIRRIRYVYFVVFSILSAALIIFAMQSPQILAAGRATIAALGTAPVLDWQPIAGWQPLLVLLYYLVINSLLLAIALPLAWYVSLVIPRRNGLSKRTTRQWLRLLARKALLRIYLEIWLLTELVTLLMVIQPQFWWAWAALGPTLFFIVMGRFGSSRFLFERKNMVLLSEGELPARFQSLRERLNLPSCALYRFNISQRTRAANAFFVGWGAGRRVVLTDTMLQQFSLDEIEVIMAHELGHLAYRDTWTRIALSGLTFMGIFGLIDLYLSVFITLNSTSSLIALLQPLYLLLGVGAFLVFLRLSMRYRRYQEYRADEYALRATNNIQAFKSAMTRLTNMNILAIASPRRARRSTTHPTLVKRLRHADQYAQRRSL